MLPHVAGAQETIETHWSASFFLGNSWSVPLPLTIERGGEPTHRQTGRYETRPWRDAPYYGYRVARWRERSAWEMSLIHHKLYLVNPPADIERFEVSHGYNLVTIGRTVRHGDVVLRGGGGVVVAHSEISSRNADFTPRGALLVGDYQLAGPTTQVGVGLPPPNRRGLSVGAEVVVSASWARVRGRIGAIPFRATVPNAAVHALVGVAFRN